MEENNEDSTAFNLEQLKIELRDKTLRKLKMFDYRKEDERMTVKQKFYMFITFFFKKSIAGQF